MFHINENGDAAPCKATKGRCPFGGIEQHYESAAQARRAYEHRQESFNGADETKNIPHEMTLSPRVKELLNAMREGAYTPYVVGGAVRDSLLSGKLSKDIDIEVFDVLSIDELESYLRKTGFQVDTVGKSFGVLKITLGAEDIDISLPRRESTSGQGHRNFDVIVDNNLSLADAAGRRDLTINALYYDDEKKLIIDAHGGVEDYKQGVLRHINEHFQEDPLRVLRAVQFAGRFSMSLAPETAQLAQSMRNTFSSLPAERIQTEFEKLFSKGSLVHGMRALQATGWHHELGLELDDKVALRGEQALERARALEGDSGVYASAWLLTQVAHARGKQHLAQLMLLGSRRQMKALHLQELSAPAALDEVPLRAWARAIEKNHLNAKDYYIFSGHEPLRKAAESYGIFERPDEDFVTGALALELSGRQPGLWIGHVIRRANEAQDAGIIRSSDDAQRWLREQLDTMSDDDFVTRKHARQ